MYSMPWEDNMLDAQLNEHPKEYNSIIQENIGQS